MDWIIELGIEVVIFLQSLGGWLTAPMTWFSFLGTENFFLMIAPAFLWCVDATMGLRAGLALTLSICLNSIFKLILRGPRPYWISADVQALSAEQSFGAPSGHAQNAVAVWGALAAGMNRRAAWILAILLIFFIGISRLYLGMHFPHDVIVGWLIGALLLILFLRIERRIKPWLVSAQPAHIIIAAFGLSLAMMLFAGAFRWAVRGWSLPEAMAPLAARPPGADPIDPLSLSGAIAAAAAFFGMATGGTLLRQTGWFDAGGRFWLRVARFVIGLIGMLVIYIGLDMIFPEGDSLVALLFRYVRYALVGLWIAFLAPQVFIRLRLAKRPGEAAPTPTNKPLTFES